ncbi:MAG: type II 3-dehydroquinate dehydratase [Chitinophagaceae bacterium]|nr:type II 3-dehydroquinate dehydratase [Chitinophagaceae bacterium]
MSEKKLITIINGPNLNLLGKREPEVYGHLSFEEYLEEVKKKFPDTEIRYVQSNVEGEIINALHEAGFTSQGIVLNPGGYTHTSVAIGDAIAAVPCPVVEVHISNIYGREVFRRISHVSAKAAGVITGLGLKGYELAILFLTGK